MRRVLFLFGGICLVMSGRANGAGAETAASPTFNKDIAPILYQNCVTCHRPGEVAPMSLLSYKEARPWARAMKTKVLAGEMPPWGADPQYGKFRNAPHLTKSHIDTLVAWVDAGAPEGEGTAPAPPVFPAGGWNATMGREPDFIAEMPVEMQVPPVGEFPDLFDIYSKAPFTQDKFLEAVQLRPGNRRVTHHSSIRAQPLPEGTKIGTAPAWPGGPLMVNAVAVPADSDKTPVAGMTASGGDDNPLLVYVPGGGFIRYRPGVARRITPEDYFVWRLHYTATGKPETDRHTLGLWFQTAPVTHVFEAAEFGSATYAQGKELIDREQRPNIPAFADNYSTSSVRVFPQAVTISSLWPHMHWRGKDMTFIVTYPDGREETILSVPKYQFAWQFLYELEEPLKLPAGSVMRIVAHYDNSAKNRTNPAPDKEVVWGGQSWEEMFTPFVDLWVDDHVIDPSKPAPPRRIKAATSRLPGEAGEQ